MEELLELEVTGLAHDGRAVARDGGRVVFVRGGLPGQKVRVRLTQVKKRFAEGECVAVLAPAPDAVPAACPHANVCGGCPLQEMPLTSQHFWKKRFIEDAFTRIGKINDAPVEELRPSPKSWGYRNKMEFAFGSDPGIASAVTLGLRCGGGHAVFDARECMLLPAGAMEVLDMVRQLARESGLPAWNAAEGAAGGGGVLRFAVLRMPHVTEQEPEQQCLVTIITSHADAMLKKQMGDLGRELLERCPAVTGFVHEERCAVATLAQGEKTVSSMGNVVLHERLGGMAYSVDHGGFFQVNTAAAEHLCSLAEEMAALTGHEKLWDLYCGVGAPGLLLAAKAHSLQGVEYASRAVAKAKANAAALRLNHCQYETGDAREVLPRWMKSSRPDVVLVDPPRVGLHADVVAELLKAKAQRIVYISCNPATLARDAALLAPGYKLARVVPVDLFPQTAHVESVSLFLPVGK